MEAWSQVEGVLKEVCEGSKVSYLQADAMFLPGQVHGVLHYALVLQLGQGAGGVDDLSRGRTASIPGGRGSGREICDQVLSDII